MRALEMRLPLVSAGIAIAMPPSFFLRSLTINPVFSDEGDGTSRTTRAFWHTLALTGRATSVKKRPPILWAELQVSTLCESSTVLPQIDILASSAFGFMPSLRTDWFRSELSRALTIINATTLDQSATAIEAAYGPGTRAISKQVECPTADNWRYVGLKRPKYNSTSPSDTMNCYFAAAVCQDVKALSRSFCITLRALPVDRITRCPVNARMAIKKGESVTFWVPFRYPSSLASLTGDERRFLSLRVGWTHQANDPAIEEILSFPRVASRFRVGATTPEFIVSPTLLNDPPVWSSQSGPTFALAAMPIKPITLDNYSECGLFLALEDSEDKEQRQLHQVWLSIVVGMVVGSVFSTAITMLLSDKPQFLSFVTLVILTLILLGGGLLLLLRALG